MSRKRFTQEEKYAIGIAYAKRDCSAVIFAKQHGVHKRTINEWRSKYERHEIKGLAESKKYKKHSEAFKKAVVEEYLSGDDSLREVSNKHGLLVTDVTEFKYGQSKKAYLSGFNPIEYRTQAA